MFSLLFLFLTLPLYFSHIFMHFGVVMGDVPSFERQKMYLFSLTIVITLVEMLFTRYALFVSGLRKYWYILLVALLLPLVPVLLSSGEGDTYWIRGSYEKFHGYLLYSGMICFVFCLMLLHASERKNLIRMSLISVTIVSIIALIEASGVSVFFARYGDIWGGGFRTISTLGNPNYLAGYLLILLPYTFALRAPEGYMLPLLVGAAVVSTQSYIGIALMGIYGIYLLLDWWGFSFLPYRSKTDMRPEGAIPPNTSIRGNRCDIGEEGEPLSSPLMRTKESISPKMNLKETPTGGQNKVRLTLGVTLIIAGLIAVLGYLIIPTDKLLSLTSRFVLMGEIGTEMIRYPFVFLTGFGPEAVLGFFSESRSPIVDAYFPRGSLIDSSHNILLDIVFQYGILPVALFTYFIYKNWNHWNHHARASTVLGIAFLMFNPYVVVHLMILSLSLSIHDDRH